MQTLGVRIFQIVFLVWSFVVSAGAQAPTADKIFETVRAKYEAMTSYSDTGTVTYEYGHDTKDTHKFVTLFSRSPRGYLLEFTKVSGERFVIWGDPEAFHTWWSAINSRSDYPNPTNTGAFVGSDFHTYGMAQKVTALLYPKAQFPGSFGNMTDLLVGGTEEIAGHKCYRLEGRTRDIYGATGRETNIRKITIWVDVDSYLIRKVVEVPKEVLPGHVDRTTTNYDPFANPTIDQSRFKFVPPR
jgi:outer membrane lipoprotein-sorting protein